ncbi:hypothetical protein OESDEN_02145 [Oesophagostomum dentatum]|uniref:C2H2-type domain-containing protein n=1 Tax=Oesophagostomum dentatum TaxID=61180 RepID=A0A0B1TJY3_OESDE|nr:hypothetical protein OESDEN_02145 [Oesophagostomum dentatum]
MQQGNDWERRKYCNREFDDEKVLIQHQKAKHFKCHICHKKLFSGPGLAIHCMQVHKETIDKIPGAVPGRDSAQMEIYGMQGIPPGTTRGDEEPEAKRDRKDDMPPMPPGPMPSMPPMMPGMPPFPPFPMMPPMMPPGMPGMPPFMPPPPGMGMPPVPPYGMPAPPAMGSSSTGPALPKPGFIFFSDTFVADEEPEAKRDRKDDMPPMPPGPMPSMPPMMPGMPPFPPFPMMPPMMPPGMPGMPPFMPPPPGMGMPPVPPYGMPAPPTMGSSSAGPALPKPGSAPAVPPETSHEEGRAEYDTDYRSAAEFNRGPAPDFDRGPRDGYGYEGGDHYGSDDYPRNVPPKEEYRSPREDFKNPREDYGSRDRLPPEEYSRDDPDGYARGRGDYNNRMPPYDGHDYPRGMPPHGDDYPRGPGSRFDRPPDDRGPPGGPYGNPPYNGNGMGPNSSSLNSSAAAVANKIGAKTRIIHPDDHQTLSLEERRAMMIMGRSQYQ